METPRFIDERELAKISGRAVQTLRNDRHHGKGFPYVRIGKSIRYNLQDILSYMEAHKVQTEPV